MSEIRSKKEKAVDELHYMIEKLNNIDIHELIGCVRVILFNEKYRRKPTPILSALNNAERD